jgi:hypothetical protein
MARHLDAGGANAGTQSLPVFSSGHAIRLRRKPGSIVWPRRFPVEDRSSGCSLVGEVATGLHRLLTGFLTV